MTLINLMLTIGLILLLFIVELLRRSIAIQRKRIDIVHGRINNIVKGYMGPPWKDENGKEY